MKKENYVMPLLLLFFYTVSFSQTFPDKTWNKYEDPAAHGWNPEKLRTYRDFITDSTVVTGLMIVQGGNVVFEYGDLVENSYIASCRKSVLAILYGEYVESGQINLTKTIADLQIDDVEGILPVEQKATVQDIISARSGVYHPEGYPGGMQQYAPQRGSVTPGSYWLYSNWDFNVAGFIFEEETGKNIYDEVERQLAHPLNMQDWQRSLQNKQGDTTISKYLAYPMWFSTRDMARIGHLMLNEGNWQGKQLISINWVDEMLAQRTSYQELNENVPVFRDTGVDFGYGYMWWFFENVRDPRLEDAYVALGAMGQAIAVYPAIDVVVAYKTKAAYRRRNSMPTRLKLLTQAVEGYEMN